MRKIRTTKLRLTSLENRVTPAATYAFTNGNLTVTTDNGPNAVILTGTAGNITVWQVSQDLQGTFFGDPSLAGFVGNPTFFRGTYAVTGDVRITGGNSADLVVLTIDDGGSLPNNVTINTGNGNDLVQFQTVANVVPASVSGRTYINGGLGAEDFNIFDFVLNDLQIVGGGNGLRANSIGQPNPGVPNDAFTMSNSTINGLANIASAEVLLSDSFGPNTINSLVVNNSAGGLSGNYQMLNSLLSYETFPFGTLPGAPGAYTGLLAIGPTTTVTGNVTYVGSSAGDGVYVLGTINGNLSVSAGAGNNDLFIGNGLGSNYLNATGVVNGGVNFIASNGNDRVTMGDAAVIAGGATLNMGDGLNSYDFAHTFTVLGNFSITAGSGNDNVGAILGAVVNGNQYYNLGNGNNALAWAGNSASARFDFYSGSGTDNLIINGVNGFALNAYLGAGNDTFSYGGPGTTVGSAYLDFGAGIDTYNQNGATIGWNQTIVNL